MKIPHLFLAAGLSASLLTGCLAEKKDSHELKLIPFPDTVEMAHGVSDCTGPMSLATNLTGEASQKMLAYLEAAGVAGSMAPEGADKNILNLRIVDSGFDSPEAYRMKIGKNNVEITAMGEAGLFYGVQTLRQLLETESRLPLMSVSDAPRFDYRGLHLDVSRHFYPKEFILKHLEYMSQYKLNRFHWHLTDGAGWRLQIDKYPLLTEVAAWRPFETWKDWAKGGNKYCTQDAEGARGGFYTKDDVREIVAYAADRYITVIPEIELPGHSEEVLAVYPELGCSGKPYKHSEFCVGNEKTFEFLEGVFDEVIELFPSDMIHLGGDEANKSAWKECPKCQKRMADNNLKDVDELQSYIIRRMGAYLNAKGKTFIGWDEILEGGLAENAVVMSWRGEEGGIKAVKSGHEAIMTPGGYCYFDSYQLEPSTQPEAISGYLTVEKVYSYNPVPDSLNAEEAKLIKGVQANLWTEYIPTQEHAEYMIYPRLLSLSEVAWSDKIRKDYEDFKPRLNTHVNSLRAKGVNACPLNPRVEFDLTPDTAKQVMRVALKTDLSPAKVFYTLDGTEPNERSIPYKEPFEVKEPAVVNAVVYYDNKPAGEPRSKAVSYHKGIGKKITYNKEWSAQYPAGGENALINGLYGAYGYGDGRWQGFLKGMDVTVDMGEVTDIRKVKAKFMQIIGPWVWMPAQVEVFVSNDGKEFTSIHQEKNPVPVDQDGVIFRDFGFEGAAQGRYIRYVAEMYKGFIFTDELIIE